MTSGNRATIPRAIREILACPKCHGTLDDAPDGEALVCRTCRLRYPVRDGIPILLIDAAESTS